MSTVQEIEAAIQHLPEQDVWRLDDWLAEYKARLWDKQLAADAAAGRLDQFIHEAKADYHAGRTHRLP
jgi:hypothetical protein